MSRISLDYVNGLDQAAFVEQFGSVFEHSPWVAERAWAARPFASREALHRAMLEAMHAAPCAEQLALIHAHPDLVGRAAARRHLTAESQREQAGAGLDSCTDAEMAALERYNAAYKEKFGFPFIIAVRASHKQAILTALAQRLENDRATEFQRALEEIGKIAGFRLGDLVAE
ncbi:MAG TPA: 2-oxo-4-hydroxy-4-carboxy-5-ureidoimidazoline decarboxylase [Candidatus Competibacteraceae bacterium]|nr:2-oxo-4-hydroxy-4-carboxy-5-ureidoimidazoline decarboxylase [Candidatus Competibacteraceae bacterium]